MAKNLISFDINCRNVTVNPNNGSSVTVTLDDVEKSDVLDHFDIVECLDHFGEDDVIGQLDNRKLEAWAKANGYTKE